VVAFPSVSLTQREEVITMKKKIVEEAARAIRQALTSWSGTARACCLMNGASLAAAVYHRFR
jgi:hypothetical protein